MLSNFLLVFLIWNPLLADQNQRFESTGEEEELNAISNFSLLQTWQYWIRMFAFLFGRLVGFTSPVPTFQRAVVVWVNLICDLWIYESFYSTKISDMRFCITAIFLTGVASAARVWFEHSNVENGVWNDAKLKRKQVVEEIMERQRNSELHSVGVQMFVDLPIESAGPTIVYLNPDQLKTDPRRISLDGACCGICGESMTDEDDISFCADCESPHHLDCWRYFGRCSIYGCGQWENDVLLADAFAGHFPNSKNLTN